MAGERHRNPWGLTPGRGTIRNAAVIINAVGTFAVVVLAGFFGGWLLDNYLKTTPLFVLAGVVLGIVGGTYIVIREVRRFMK